MGDKVAAPTRLLLGQTTALTLRINGDCPQVESRSDIVLVIDYSGSMFGAPLDLSLIHIYPLPLGPNRKTTPS